MKCGHRKITDGSFKNVIDGGIWKTFGRNTMSEIIVVKTAQAIIGPNQRKPRESR